ncbi:hypothetical protein M080_5270, partial [Bacteroides fragilis str. 3397 T10]
MRNGAFIGGEPSPPRCRTYLSPVLKKVISFSVF